MKTKLILPCLLFSTMLAAQVTNLPTVLNIHQPEGSKKAEFGVFGVVPSSLSYDGTNRVYIRPADDQVAIYTNDFTPVKQFNISTNYSGYQFRSATREVTFTVTGGEVILEGSDTGSPIWVDYKYDTEATNYLYIYEIPANWTSDSIIRCIRQHYNSTPISRVETTEEGVVYIPDWDLKNPDDSYNESDYFMPETYGKQYARRAYVVKNNYLYYLYRYYHLKTKGSFSYGEWQVSDDYKSEERVQTWGLAFVNYDNDQLMFSEENGDGLCLTQTLFNDDAQYEYIYFPISSYALSGGNEPQNPICEDCYQESRTYTEETTLYYSAIFTCFEIKSETGNTLQSISFPNGFVMRGSIYTQIIKLNNEYYLICTGEMNSNPAMLVYKINRNNKQSVQQVGAPIRMSAFPNPVQRDNTITIQLSGENAGKAQTELQVTNLQGQVVDRRLIPAGQQQTTAPATYFSPGMNMIRVLQNGKTIGTTKILAQ